MTLPVAANLISRSTYLAEGIPHELDTVDELAAALDRAAADNAQPPPAGEGYSG